MGEIFQLSMATVLAERFSFFDTSVLKRQKWGQHGGEQCPLPELSLMYLINVLRHVLEYNSRCYCCGWDHSHFIEGLIEARERKPDAKTM